MRVYLDFDDVISETFRALAVFAKTEFGREPVPGKQIHFDLRESLGIPEEEYRTFMERFHAEALEDIPEIPGASAAMRSWLRDGVAEPVVVTGRPLSAHGVSVAWLGARGLPGVQVLHVDKYHRFSAGEKGVVRFSDLPGMGFALAVDDAPAALDALAQADFCRVAAFDRPWNRAWPPSRWAGPVSPPRHGPPLRFTSWTELDAEVRSMAAAAAGKAASGR